MTSTQHPTCGRTEAAFGTIYQLDALAIAASALGLFGTCLDTDATADVAFTIDSRGTTGNGSLI